MSSLNRLTLLVAALALLPAASAAQTLLGPTDSVFTWQGPLKATALFTARNFNGPIDVRPAAGDRIEFRAERLLSRGSGEPVDVSIDVQTTPSGDVTICAVARAGGSCDDDGSWGNRGYGRSRRLVIVAMTVMVPRGARVRVVTGNGALTVDRVGGDLQATTGNGRVRITGTEGAIRVTTGNGDVDVTGARGPVRVTTGNGDVRVATDAGPVDARSGNGDIDVRMTAVRLAEAMTFSTGSGAVRVTLPANYAGELDASTGNGELRSDFDLKVQGRLNPRRIRATIGAGGPVLRLATGNGALEVRKAP